jgi:cytochrome c
MNVHFAALMISVLLSAPGITQADEALAKKKNCIACHAVDTKRVGPSYKEIANRYAGQKDIEARLAEKIIKGSRGAWTKELGREVLMPPNATVKPEDAAKLTTWILGLK